MMGYGNKENKIAMGKKGMKKAAPLKNVFASRKPSGGGGDPKPSHKGHA